MKSVAVMMLIPVRVRVGITSFMGALLATAT
jgi:hypothetical protein